MFARRGQITKREGAWRNDRTYRFGVLQSLRQQARYILLDCPSLRKSNEAIGLASLVDGVLLVVEANRTTKEQVSYLERSVSDAGGRVLGHVLNKRTYPIPESVFSRLQKWGV
jgi:Mrp family chromosome partitioning ATPase